MVVYEGNNFAQKSSNNYPMHFCYHLELTVIAAKLVGIYTRLGGDKEKLCDMANMHEIFKEFEDDQVYQQKYKKKVKDIMDDLFEVADDVRVKQNLYCDANHATNSDKIYN